MKVIIVILGHYKLDKGPKLIFLIQLYVILSFLNRIGMSWTRHDWLRLVLIEMIHKVKLRLC